MVFAKETLVAVVGPTGTGKSHLALRLAAAFNGEIVNADSLQLYRHMNIGTAKPSREEMELVPHHLFNIVDPDADFNLAEYLARARAAIQQIHDRGRLPFLVGGSGQYVAALVRGWDVPAVTPHPELRRGLEKLASDEGPDAIYRRLRQIDPVAADRIDRRNIRRVVRALEVSQTSGVPFSEVRRKKASEYLCLMVGLTADRSSLYSQLDARVDHMMEHGLVNEVENLIRLGYGLELPALNSIGYKQIGMFLRNETNLNEAVRLIKIANHRLVRHQYAWFKLKDRSIHWFDVRRDAQLEVMLLLSDSLSSD